MPRSLLFLVFYFTFCLCNYHSCATDTPTTLSVPLKSQTNVPKDDEFWSADKRLEQKVNIIAKRRTLSAIISDLSKQTGINLQAGLSVLDW